jgi:plasmid maintenance system killer protein
VPLVNSLQTIEAIEAVPKTKVLEQPQGAGQKHLLSEEDGIEEIWVNRCLEYLPFGT